MNLQSLVRLLGRTQSDSQAVTGPDSVEVTARHLRVGAGYAATLTVTGYPAEVGAGWLEPLLCYPGRLDVAMHIDPIPPAKAAAQLKRQRGRMQSDSSASGHRIEDPELEAAIDDARAMAHAIARGESRLFDVGLYLTVHAQSKEDLDAEVEQVKALCSSMLLAAQPASFRALQGWITTLPLGVDALRMRRTLDTPALSASFPFTSPDLPAQDLTPGAAPTGVLYGQNSTSSGLLFWDRWSADNYNSVTLATSGAGKSFATKLEVLRSLYDHRDGDPTGHEGVQVWVIDPEDEYRRLSDAVGGTYLSLGSTGVRLNPFDLPDNAGPETLIQRSLFLHTLTAVMLDGTLTPQHRAALDRTVTATYASVGITADPRTWRRQAPLLSDLVDILAADDDEAAKDLGARLAPFATGAFSGLFAGQTTHLPQGHLVVFSLRNLPDELRPVGTLLALDSIWRHATNPRARRRRLIIVDEAWMLMQQPEAARYLLRMAKGLRKHWAGLAFVSQDAADVLGSDLGTAIVSNAATQILMRQAPQAIGAIAKAFRLSMGERGYLLSASPGDALLVSGTNRIAFTSLASPTEARLITTNPQELAELEEQS
ncbi:conjugal transfer protein TraC [Pseudonocardiaceae bacterium YIM PH 21723]|nr:conjugal transfer protein TraC [Pseudonocardiaceae bacterium YIM PH 21723]